MALRRTFRVTLALSPLLVAMACVPQNNEPKAGNKTAASGLSAPAISTGGAVTDVTTPQPRTATYSCADGGRMTIENLGTSVRVLGSDGTSEDLLASPANQNSRYEQAHDAIVIDGREALVMKAGSTPVTCKR
ncbi:hypothetical protein BPNPMPFG_004198 [Mesorhizobium sp. AR07]|uniref:hypothetical protein n=1 Tax=Mesorhizobium sp. AR07 TaxID=2865838 RepID=UPI00215FC415|nr:hypothetical protein [Mesorhizobium sp. AR07]UVK42507.1 hypothetical protein BPNPMPFG_004198 [Mesorhizobium sp. AR07]